MRIRYRHRAELRSAGMNNAGIAAAVAGGHLIRARRDHYVTGDVPDAIVRAVRVGGRLTCVSLLALAGVFVLRHDALHVHMPHTASRMRSPHDRFRPLEVKRQRGVRLHWLPLVDDPGQDATVSVIDALVHATLCQTPRAAVATLDSARHLGLIDEEQLAEVFRRLPRRFDVLRRVVDERAEAGSESIARLLLRSLGCSVEVQVRIDGVGRVDLLVDGWLVIECDSREFHGGWEAQERDRLRDLRLAAAGYTTLRPTARMIFDEPELLLRAVRGLLATRR
jgi:very-short-patch-repair endonuclease